AFIAIPHQPKQYIPFHSIPFHSSPSQVIFHFFPIFPSTPLTCEGMQLDLRGQRVLERDLGRTHHSPHSTLAVILPLPLVTHSIHHSLPSLIRPYHFIPSH